MLSTGSSRRWRSSTVSSPTRKPIDRGSGHRPDELEDRVPSENSPATAIAAIAVRSTTSADASLTRLSPSSTAISRGGSPTRRPIAVAATASVGLTTAPRAVGERERDAGEDPVHHRADHQRRDDHHHDREPGDQREVAADVDHRQVDRRGVEQRRQNAGQDQLRLDVDRRRARAGSSRRCRDRRAAGVRPRRFAARRRRPRS